MSDFQSYLSEFLQGRRLSETKKLILKRLWDSDETSFPKPWVSSDELLELTGQKYFDRRARELRDAGCDLESEYRQEFSGHGWRLLSNNINKISERYYLSNSEKIKLFESNNYTCSTCGLQQTAGVRGLQADHKIPLSRGGSNNIYNWQPLCHNCNVGKRRACSGCELSCDECSWAFPDKHGVFSIFKIHEKNLRKINSIAIKEKITPSELLNKLIEDL